jgi:hypothetical protein
VGGWPAKQHWLDNQGALLSCDPQLAAVLADARPGQLVVQARDGRWGYRRNRGVLSLELRPAVVGRALGEGPSPQVVRVLGVGCGELVAAALIRWPDATVVAWDREPASLRLAMELHDFSTALRSGRLRLFAGARLLDMPRGGEQARDVIHPVLASERDRGRCGAGSGAPWVVLGEGGLFVDDLDAALTESGWWVWRMHLDSDGPEWLTSNLRDLRARAVFRINHALGLSEHCARLGIPLVEWEIDPALDGMRAAKGPTDGASLFTWRVANVRPWKALGFPGTRYLPLAANTEKRRPIEEAKLDRAKYGAPVAFVGNSQAEHTPRLRAALQGLIEVWARGRGVPDAGAEARRLIQLLFAEASAALPENAAPALVQEHCPGLDAQRVASGVRSDPAMLLAEIVGAVWRLQAVGCLAPQGVHVWGDPGWKVLARNGVNIRGFAGHSTELTSIYNSVDVNVDIGRIYQADIVTMRVFDVLACGGFLLAAWSEGLGELFELGTELDTWRTLPELQEKVRFYLARPALRQAMAARGRARVLRDHRVRDRVQTMLRLSGVGSPDASGPGAVSQEESSD